MPLSPGSRIGAYEVVSAIGAGGMGSVHRARDTRLGRDVALKLLPDAMAADSERRARFEREARTLASLNHPGIVTIYGIESAGDATVIAMELVEGRTLADAIPKGGFALDRLLAIAVQIADAIAAAHKHGIVHRDLKPANVMLGAHDRVKVLDFGLAKGVFEQGGDAATLLPTKDITGEGRIMGTVAYMSPEQAEGRKVDERSDVFSFGVLFYEMATGERPFKGDTGISILSSILKDAPRPINEVNPALPREVARIVRRCLAKGPDDRYHSVSDLRNDLEDVKQSALSGELRAVAAAPATTTTTPWIVAAVLAAIAIAAVAWSVRGQSSAAASTTPLLTFSRLTMLEGVVQDPMISPDGKWVVYTSGISGNQDIYLQSTTGQTPINLTKDSPVNESTPAFSPDGELIAFRSARDGGGLFVMGRTGESVRRLTRTGFQPAWFPDGRQIVFASRNVVNPDTRGGDVSELWVVGVNEGEPRKLFAGDAVLPRVSPNGRRIAFWALDFNSDGKGGVGSNRDVWTIAADGSSPVRVTSGPAIDWNPVWAPDGSSLYFLSNQSGSMNLWRVALDEATGATTGEPEPLTTPSAYIRHFSLSKDGTLATYATFNVTNNLSRVRFDPKGGAVLGAPEPITTGSRDFQFVDISPDGQQIVLGNSSRTQEDLFVLPTSGGVLRNLTSDAFRERAPRWSGDGRKVFFYSDRADAYEIWSVDRDGGSLRQVTKTDTGRYYPVPSHDGKQMVASDIGAWKLFLFDGADLSTAHELPPVPAELRIPGGSLTPVDFSPDGNTVLGVTTGGVIWTYSLDSKTYRRIGTAGGGPRWLPDGKRLLVSRGGRLILIDVATGQDRELFAIRGEAISNTALSPDGSMIYFLSGTASGDVWLMHLDNRP